MSDSWLILREPGKVPQLKGPFAAGYLAGTLREFMTARPTAFITVLDISHGVPGVQDGPECLEVLDGRSTATSKKHRASTAAAFAMPPCKNKQSLVRTDGGCLACDADAGEACRRPLTTVQREKAGR